MWTKDSSFDSFFVMLPNTEKHKKLFLHNVFASDALVHYLLPSSKFIKFGY